MIPVRSFLVILLLGCVIPVAVAHTDGGIYGTPKTYCEYEKGDYNVHDYAPDASSSAGYFLLGFYDGNAADCDFDGVPFDFDGHSEWALGGAYLLASEHGWSSFPSGATTCFGEAAHHPAFPSIWVFDHTWPTEILFIVGTDTTSFPQPASDDPTNLIDCGDGIDDVDSGYCVDHCTLDMPPGKDGAYHVYIVAEFTSEGQGDLGIHLRSAGHVYT